MKLLWLPETRHDIQRLHDFLAPKSPQAASRAIRAIQSGARELLSHPEIGRPRGDAAGHRELFVPFGVGAYVLRYRVIAKADTVVVVRVWHSREQREG